MFFQSLFSGKTLFGLVSRRSTTANAVVFCCRLLFWQNLLSGILARLAGHHAASRHRFKQLL
jgi:hypothetical protein